MRKNNVLKQRRGFTLAELTAVLAIMTIIISSIVGFSTLFSSQVKTNEARAAFLEETAAFRTYVQQVFAERDTNTLNVSVEENKLFFNGDKFSFSTEKYDQIDTVVYATNGKLLKITVSNTDLNETQSFVIFSRCGATFEEGGTQP